jgi:hypothetical protein
MSNARRNLIAEIVAVLFGGYAISQWMRGHGQSAYEACFLGGMICFLVFRAARVRPPAASCVLQLTATAS